MGLCSTFKESVTDNSGDTGTVTVLLFTIFCSMLKSSIGPASDNIGSVDMYRKELPEFDVFRKLPDVTWYRVVVIKEDQPVTNKGVPYTHSSMISKRFGSLQNKIPVLDCITEFVRHFTQMIQ